MKIRFINAVCILALILASACKSGKRLRVYTIVDFSFIRTFAP